jgi:hypothetical protein
VEENMRNIFSKSLIYVGFTYLDGNPGVGRTQKYRGVKQNITKTLAQNYREGQTGVKQYALIQDYTLTVMFYSYMYKKSQNDI